MQAPTETLIAFAIRLRYVFDTIRVTCERSTKMNAVISRKSDGDVQTLYSGEFLGLRTRIIIHV